MAAITREETYLAYLTGEYTGALPMPITRREQYLYSICVNGGGSGTDGKSAYEIAVENGYEGTEEEWLESLKGEDGKSAYEIAVENGYEGTEAEWLESLTAVGEEEVNSLIDAKTEVPVFDLADYGIDAVVLGYDYDYSGDNVAELFEAMANGSVTIKFNFSPDGESLYPTVATAFPVHLQHGDAKETYSVSQLVSYSGVILFATVFAIKENGAYVIQALTKVVSS